MTAWWITGDTLQVLRQMPDASVDMVLTSPPFLALRSYLPDDDPAKVHEVGQEKTPGEFLDVLLDITEELRRVVAPHGSICVELGDTYSGSGGAGGDYNDGGLREGQQEFSGSARKRAKAGVIDGGRPPRTHRSDGWPADKSLCMIPELYRVALVYGFNPLTGRTTPRWRARNVIRWTRPNPPVGALGDKFRPATSDMVIACGTDEAGRRRYFDLDAVREAPRSGDPGVDLGAGPGKANGAYRGVTDGGGRERVLSSHPAGVPPLDWWEIPTHGYKGSHYATWPPALCVRPIKAMCPLKVCTVCGEPSRRITDVTYDPLGDVETQHAEHKAKADYAGQQRNENAQGMAHGRATKNVETVGWTDCGHGDNWRTGRVLDPFAGSGTTGMVATGHGRDFIGIDLDARNVDLARDRIGALLLDEVTVTELREAFEPGGRAA